ncbi:MAG: hypothetical protein ACK58T_28805, partial [Phycisphaerae bacterium]
HISLNAGNSHDESPTEGEESSRRSKTGQTRSGRIGRIMFDRTVSTAKAVSIVSIIWNLVPETADEHHG